MLCLLGCITATTSMVMSDVSSIRHEIKNLINRESQQNVKTETVIQMVDLMDDLGSNKNKLLPDNDKTNFLRLYFFLDQ